MNPDVKDMWLKALRSGEYEQTTGYLREAKPDGKEGYCCLGVLCELAVKEGVLPAPVMDSASSTYEYADEDGTTVDVLPPVSVAKWAGFTYRFGDPEDSEDYTTSPEVEIPKGHELYGEIVGDWCDPDDPHTAELTYLNDTAGLNFNQIADLIEKGL